MAVSAVWEEGRAGPGQGGAAWQGGSGPPLGGAVGRSSYSTFLHALHLSLESHDFPRGLESGEHKLIAAVG